MEYTELKKKLIQCCYWYYVKGRPLLSDYEFDHLIYDLKKMEETRGADPDSPTQIIWGGLESQYNEVLGNFETTTPPSLYFFDTVKIIVSWSCTMGCTYCSNNLDHIKKSFKPIQQKELKHLPHSDFELTGGEITLPQNFSILCEVLSNWLPKGRNYYVYSNGLWLNEWHTKLLKKRGVRGINIGVHIGQKCHFTLCDRTSIENATTIVNKLNWDELIKCHTIIPIRLWVKEDEVKEYMYEFPFELITWKLGDCDRITTDRYYLSK